MSIEQFWRTVKFAERELDAVHQLLPDPSSGAGPRLLMLDLWLTPAVVEDFDPADFSFLSEDEQDALGEAVERFRAVAREVPPDALASLDQIGAASPDLKRIARILQVSEFDDANEYKLARLLRAFESKARSAAPWLARFVTSFELDADGKDAAWIYAIVSDEFAESPDFFEDAEELRRVLEDYLRIRGVSLPLHVRFRSVSDQEEDEEEMSEAS